MTEASHCPHCGAKLPDATAEGLCPACLLLQALGDAESEMLPAMEAVREGTRFGDYEVIGVLGRGGMGVVYAARQLSLNRKVALKMVRSPQLATEADLARFQQEAEAAGRLDHPNIVPVYEIGEQQGMCYFTMKLVEHARSLASEVADKPMEPTRATQMMVKIARAIHYAHQRGVIHRDIKPGNILLDVTGEPTLADFGLAKLQEADVSLTLSNRMIGTPQYMSPEQVSLPGSELTTATDVYSLGAVLYEMLTGRPPFQSDSIHEVLRQVVEQDPKPLRLHQPHLDRELQTICLKCLEKDPRRRYASAHDLAEDLENWLAVRPITARPVSAAGRVRKWARRRPGVAVLTGALTIALLIAGVSVLYAWRKSEATLDQALEGFASKAAALRFNKDRPGHRWEALDAIAQAVAIRPVPSLRDEAIACLSLADMRPAEDWPVSEEERSCRGALSPDFQLQAQSYPDGKIIVRSLQKLEERASIPGSGHRVQGVLRFSADSRYLAVARGTDSELESALTVWDMEAKSAVAPDSAVVRDCFDFMPDGKRVVVGTKDALLMLELPSFKELRRMSLPSAPNSVRCSADGRFVAVSLTHGGVEVFDTTSADAPPLVFSGCDAARGIAWHPRRKILAIPSEDGRIFVWDVTKDPRTARFWVAHFGVAESVVWHPNGRHLFSEGADGLVDMWDSRAGILEVRLQAQSWGSLLVSADGRRLGPFLHDDQVQTLEINDGAVVRYGEGHPGSFINSAAWSPDRRVLATAGEDSVKFWNRDGEQIGELKEKGSRSVLWRADALILSGTGGLRKWPLIKPGANEAGVVRFGAPIALDARAGWEWGSVSRDGRWLAVAHPPDVALFDLSSTAPPREFKAQPKASFVSISPEGDWMAAGTWHGSGVRVWSLTQGDVRDLPVRGSANVGFNLDGKLLITGNGDEYAFWRMDTWDRVHSVPTRLGDFYGAMAFSPRGTAVAIESERNRALIIHAPSLQVLASPDFDHQRPLTFSPDGTLLVNADAQQHLIFWDLSILRGELKTLGLDWDFIPPLPDIAVPFLETAEFSR